MASQEEVQALIAQFKVEGEALGKDGASLNKYVEDSLREERAARREALLKRENDIALQEKELAAARELKERELAEQAKIENLRQEKELAAARELKERELAEQAKIENRRLDIEEEKANREAKLRADELVEKASRNKLANRPKIPYFDDKSDDIESYLYRFDKHAASLKWSNDEKALILPTLLRGRALNYFQELPVEDTNDYAKLSAHLLKRFKCTEEGFRTQFRSCKPESGETMHVFFSRMRRFFTRWTDMAGVGTDFALLCDLVLREQILSSCASSLVTFLKEDKHTTAQTMIDAAERYREAHPSQNLAAKGSSDPLLANVGIPSGRGGHSGSGGRGGHRFSKKNSQADTNPPTEQSSPDNKGGRGASQAGRGRGGQNYQRKCWWCQDTSHKLADCPKKMHTASVSVVTVEESSCSEDEQSVASVGFSGSDELPESIQTCEGTLNGSEVTVMLDSGCSTVGVRKSLVRDDQFTGKVQVCRQFSGDLVRLPIAIVSLDTPYFSGSVEACVIDNPVCDVILGRIQGCTFGCVEVTSAVQTRGQKAREERPFRPLLTAKVPQLDINAEKLSKMQRDDKTLHDLFEKVGQGKSEESSGCVVSFDGQNPVVATLGVISGSSAVEEVDIQKVKLQSVPTVQTENVDDVVYSPDLSMQAKQKVQAVFQRHQDKMTDLPGTCDLVQHVVRIPEGAVVNVKQYPLPFESQKVVEEEVKKMLDLDVIEPSISPFSSPIVLVKKKDGSTRFCIDFRHLNKITEFDAEPIPDPEVLFASLQGRQHFTKIDLAKGYWQIPMAESDRAKTAFRTPQGLYQFKKMPFGMSTAPSTFARMMKMLDLDRFKSVHFFDDVLVATEDWCEHLEALDGLLTELGKHGLTVRPSKVEAGFDSIEFLGHIVGEGSMRPVPSKVSKILNVSVPTTKKQVRSLVGLISFYRRYVPSFASIVSPLVELTKKNQPNKVRWSKECQMAFDRVKEILSSEPLVRLPDFSRPFTVRSDVSSTGIGAALMQPDDDDVLHPVLYASRKLLERETRYSTVERECLALVWAVDKFHRYLFGSHFFVETDHRPLTYLRQSKTANGRLLRWALSLQEYSFTVVPIPGVRNFEADVLSRLTK
ncbi:hypothetical protein V1264_002415 [Littorina saxatilis]|uniref:Reverse transcriptase domain-containing protein n=1 Tax=Littorina saxatilis TaxID=31220 RepID=A0AAN9C9D3_9CAEN